jgi:hypothetical protein
VPPTQVPALHAPGSAHDVTPQAAPLLVPPEHVLATALQVELAEQRSDGALLQRRLSS